MALRIAVDTNRYSDYVTGVESARSLFVGADEIHVPFVVLAELRGGYRLGNRRSRNEQGLGEFLRSPRVGVLFADDATTQFYADLYADLRRAGTPIPTNDLWIAALVVQHGLTLFTRDRHFEHVTRVPRI